MKTTTIDTELIKKNTNLIDLASRYTELRRESSREFSGACPKCGGTDRFHVTEDSFFCRQCYALENGKPHDAIALVQWLHGYDFMTACNVLSGIVAANPAIMARPAHKTPTGKPWDATEQRERVALTHRSLVEDKCPAALEYLTLRGISLETISAFEVGATLATLPNTWNHTERALSYPKQLAICLPWFNHDGALVAVKYRFTKSHTYTDTGCRTRTENKTSRGNMAGQLFGWQALKGSQACRTLIICEGEVNALSIWQASGGRIDVLSAGSESQLARLPQIAVDVARGYQQVIVWADQGNIADSAALLIPSSKRYNSPVVDGHPKGLDANDLLVAGKLADLLDTMINKLSGDDVLVQVERLLNDKDADRRRDARWVFRWVAGYTEDMPHTRQNVEAAAYRLGVKVTDP